MTNVELTEYYANLLILQYKGKPKAEAEIRALINTINIYEIIDEVKNAYNLETAKGNQLDVLGKYHNIDRTIKGAAFTRDYFGFAEYGDAAFTFFTYTEYAKQAPDVQFRSYRESEKSLYDLTDSEFLFCIKLKIIADQSNASGKGIDDFFDRYFFNQAIFSDFTEGNMAITYIFEESVERLVTIAISQGLLPKPAAVAVNVVFVPDINNIFGYSTYNDFYPNFITGYKKYNYAKAGGWLQYGTLIA